MSNAKRQMPNASVTTFCALALLAPAAAQQPAPLERQAEEALTRAVRFFRSEVSVQGSYLWSYSEDLKTRKGETEATATQGWTQPPGTPAVGLAYLRAWEATGTPEYLEAARETARALARTQLQSGGWDYRLEFDPQKRGAWFYRSDWEKGDRERGKRANVSTYDDNNTQSALRLLMRADAALKGEDPEVRRAAGYGLEKLLESQYPNGAWPQRWDGAAREGALPVAKARYPESWSRTWPGAKYAGYYTFNDGAMRDILGVLLEAHRRYGKAAYLEAARKGGDFILLAQLPEPQPAWAQQYSLEMEPAWARKFEPPSVTAGESAGVIRALLSLYLYTGDEKYLKPVPPAVEWFRRSRLPDGRWARFYELKTNRPLYFTRDYRLVYTDDDLPTHYSFRGEYGIPAVLAQYERVVRDGREKLNAPRPPRTPEQRERDARKLEGGVREVVAAQDARGRWVEKGQIRSDTFIRSLALLSDYLAARRSRDPQRDPE